MLAMKFFNICLLSLFILLSIVTICRTEDADCVYTIYVQTGSRHLAGTDSKISLTLNDASGSEFQIHDLEAWGGLMGSGHDYFERGNVDIFSGKGSCLKGPVCGMNLTSDGTGHNPGWYCDYVEVTTSGAPRQCAKKTFTVQQWLEDHTTLVATRNDCPRTHMSSVFDGQDLPKISVVVV